MAPSTSYQRGSESDDSSSESSPDTLLRSKQASAAPIEQNSTFLKLPVDIFKCVMDYLDRDAAWCLMRTCSGMAKSDIVTSLLYRQPIHLVDVKDLRLSDWKFRNIGAERWEHFQNCINDSNRKHVQKLAMAHFNSIEDFVWIEENLPNLTSLDVSHIKDFVWTPEETWTWKELAQSCPKLLSRLEELEVANWADYTAHSRIEYSYSCNDYKYKLKFRLSRRRDGGSIAQMVFPVCKNLKTLSIRERYSGFHAWNEWEVHQRVCCLVDGINKYCPPSLTKLRVHDYAPYRSLFATDTTTWSNITDIEIALYSWVEERRDRHDFGPVPYRINQGHHHREEEEAFADDSFDTCQRDHMSVGNNVIRSVGASFEDLLSSLRTISLKYPNINIKPISGDHDITLHPFNLVNVSRRPRYPTPFGLSTGQAQNANSQQQSQQQERPDPIANVRVLASLKWLSKDCGWRPILAWDYLMSDIFPLNIDSTRTLLPKALIISRIQAMIAYMRRLDIPIRVSIGDRKNSSPSGLDGNVYFGDFKTFVECADPNLAEFDGPDGKPMKEAILPTQAAFSLSYIAPFVDELTIQYPPPFPLPGTRSHSRRVGQELIDREKAGWRRFWARYASQFKNLKKITTLVPDLIYKDWGKCEGLRHLLEDDRWDMLEVDDHNDRDLCFFASYGFLSTFRYALSRRRSRVRFVRRVFFRLDKHPLQLHDPTPHLTVEEREDRQITDEDIADKDLPEHRFWPPPKSERDDTKTGKRKRDDSESETADEAKDSGKNGDGEKPPAKKKQKEKSD